MGVLECQTDNICNQKLLPQALETEIIVAVTTVIIIICHSWFCSILTADASLSDANSGNKPKNIYLLSNPSEIWIVNAILLKMLLSDWFNSSGLNWKWSLLTERSLEVKPRSWLSLFTVLAHWTTLYFLNLK